MAQTKVKLISDGVIVQGNLHSSHGITTAHIGEGSNLYYTDARVGSYLSSNGYATQSTIVAAITDSAPSTLDTLNELAAALGDDVNFSTTVTNSIALKAPLASPTFTGNATFAGNLTVGRNIDLSSTDYSYIQGTHTGASDGEYVMRTFGYGDSTFYGSFDILRHDTDDGELRLRQRIAGTATDVLSIVDGNSTFAGNVGIGGAASSTHTLDLNSSSNLALRFFDSTTFKAGMQAVHTGGQMISSSAAGDFAIRSQSNMLFSTGGNTERMRIDSSGRVGIGIDPSYKLEIKSSGAGNYIQHFVSSDGVSLGGFYENADTDALFFLKNASGAIKVEIDSDGDSYFNGGNVGIGTTSPYTNLEVAGSGLDSIIRLYAASGTANIRTWEMRAVGVAGEGLLFRQVNDANNSYTNRMIIDTDGFVGIGNTNPQSKLQVTTTGYDTGTTGFRLTHAEETNYVGYARLQTPSGDPIFSLGTIDGATTYETLSMKNGNVGIGTTDPDEKLILYKTLNYASDSALYSAYAVNSTAVDNNKVFKWKTGITGNQSGHNLTFSTLARAESSYVERMRITSGGYIKSPPTYSLTTGTAANMHVDSNGFFYRSTSSLKYKADVRDYDKGLNEVMQLQPKYYKGKTDGDKQFAGLIAEDVHDLGLTEFVQYADDGSPDALSYSHMIALLTKSIQELKAEIETLKLQING